MSFLRNETELSGVLWPSPLPLSALSSSYLSLLPQATHLLHTLCLQILQWSSPYFLFNVPVPKSQKTLIDPLPTHFCCLKVGLLPRSNQRELAKEVLVPWPGVVSSAEGENGENG